MSNLYKDIYDATMHRIVGRASAQLALKTFAWIALARCPLKIDELQHALATEPEDEDFEPDGISDVEDILSACAGLIVVEQRTTLVRFMHYSFQEYLDHFLNTHYPSAKAYVATTCLTNLSFAPVQSTPQWMYWSTRRKLPLAESLPFLDYALRNWHEHVGDLEQSVIPRLRLFIENDTIRRNVIEPQKHRTGSPSFSRDSTPLHVAIKLGFLQLFYVLLQDLTRGPRGGINTPDEKGVTLLMAAAKHGHLEMTKWCCLETI